MHAKTNKSTHTERDKNTFNQRCKHIPEQIITLRDSLKHSLSHQSPSLPPPPSPLLYSFPLPSNTTQNIDTSPPPPSFFSLSLPLPPSLSLHHSLSLLNTDRLSTPWSEFQISPSLPLPLSLHPLQKTAT